MAKLKDLYKSGHIHVALAVGVSIIVLAYVSKRLLTEPIRPLILGITPFIMVLYESVAGTRKGRLPVNSLPWVITVLVITVIIILIHIV